MRKLIKVKINELILHILSEDGGVLQLSERTLPPATSQQVFEFFSTHIANSLASQHARVARFADSEEGKLKQGVGTICRDLLARRVDFVPASQELARLLLNVVQGNKSFAEGDLVVCRYETVTGDDMGGRLALLKIKPVPVFEHAFQTDAQGITYITLVKTGAMPTTQEELQKCAFVRPLEPRPEEFDMLLLDRQGEEGEVAQFFFRSFLDAALLVDDRQATFNVLDVFTDLENRLRFTPHWERVEPELQKVWEAEKILLTPEWVKSLALPPEIEEEIEEDLKERKVLDRSFLINQQAVSKIKRRYEGDFGLKLEVQEEHFKEVVRRIDYVEDGVEQAHYEIVLRTTRFERRS